MGFLSNGGHEKVLVLKIVMVVVAMVSSTAFGAGNFHEAFEPTFGGHRVQISGQRSEQLSLSLDQGSGSGFRSKKEYMFGRIDMQMKLVGGNSAGTVTTLYVSRMLTSYIYYCYKTLVYNLIYLTIILLDA